MTETGKLVNLDMIGNRTGAITFGPLNVIIFAGRNKIVSNVETAMKRIKTYAEPLNAIRHSDLKTLCRKTSYCMDCNSPDRICNTWTITEKSFPKRRIRVVLINEDLGLKKIPAQPGAAIGHKELRSPEEKVCKRIPEKNQVHLEIAPHEPEYKNDGDF